MRILLTRPKDEAARTAAALASRGHEALISPVIEILPTHSALPDEAFDGIIMTSANALIETLAFPLALRGCPIHAVGARLAFKARDAALGEPATIARDAGDLLGRLAEAYPAPSRLLYLAGRDRKPDLERGLSERGHELVVVETYDAREADALTSEALDAFVKGEIGAVLHFSQRSARIFAVLASKHGLEAAAKRARHIAISGNAAKPLVQGGYTVRTAEASDEASIFEALGA